MKIIIPVCFVIIILEFRKKDLTTFVFNSLALLCVDDFNASFSAPLFFYKVDNMCVMCYHLVF